MSNEQRRALRATGWPFLETSAFSLVFRLKAGMTMEGFADLWSTVKDGKPWRDIVKNRRKNGDHYWVDAMVVPLRKNNQTMGYMSVRREPSRQQVDEAESLYRRITEGKIALKRSHPLDFIYRYSFQSRYIVFATALVALMALSTFAAAHGMTGMATGLVLVGAALVAVSAGFLERVMCRPLMQALDFFDQIAQGNLNNNKIRARSGQ